MPLMRPRTALTSSDVAGSCLGEAVTVHTNQWRVSALGA